MKDTDTSLLEGPEMDALRELRADEEGPTQAQRQAAWERVQGVRSQAGRRAKGGSRPWIIAAVAAVAVGVVAAGIGLSALGGGEEQPAPPASTESSPTNPNPSPFATGSVWEPQGAEQEKVVESYREDHIHLTEEGGVRIDIPAEMDWESMTLALNAEGIPVRFWAVQGTKGEWDTSPAMPIDPEQGNGPESDAGEKYPKEKITEERVGGEGSALESLTFDEIPTEPVDIQFTQ
ncbi:MAG TPA: hypothetical protein H9805_12695 [Candidatus Janibacter merdipullorum]|nr:hypothetical protein [Candidatus Janibacter merdipullorum]